MKNLLIFAIQLSVSTFCFATNSAIQYPNGIGWDNGLSYRKKLPRNYTLSIKISGDVSSNSAEYNSMNTQTNTDVDTADLEINSRSDSSLYLNTGLTLGVLKEVLKIKFISLDAFIRMGYSYYWTRNRGTNMLNNSKNESHLLHAEVGLEPSLWAFERFSFSTSFGLRYRYRFGESESKNTYENDPWIVNNESNQQFKGHNLSLVGLPFSITMNLGIHFYF